MTEDADFWDIDPTPGQSGMAFLALVTGLAWLLCLPFDLCARLRDRASGDADSEGADCFGAVEGGQLHNGEV